MAQLKKFLNTIVSTGKACGSRTSAEPHFLPLAQMDPFPVSVGNIPGVIISEAVLSRENGELRGSATFQSTPDVSIQQRNLFSLPPLAFSRGDELPACTRWTALWDFSSRESLARERLRKTTRSFCSAVGHAACCCSGKRHCPRIRDEVSSGDSISSQICHQALERSSKPWPSSTGQC